MTRLTVDRLLDACAHLLTRAKQTWRRANRTPHRWMLPCLSPVSHPGTATARTPSRPSLRRCSWSTAKVAHDHHRSFGAIFALALCLPRPTLYRASTELLVTQQHLGRHRRRRAPIAARRWRLSSRGCRKSPDGFSTVFGVTAVAHARSLARSGVAAQQNADLRSPSVERSLRTPCLRPSKVLTANEALVHVHVPPRQRRDRRSAAMTNRLQPEHGLEIRPAGPPPPSSADVVGSRRRRGAP